MHICVTVVMAGESTSWADDLREGNGWLDLNSKLLCKNYSCTEFFSVVSETRYISQTC